MIKSTTQHRVNSFPDIQQINPHRIFIFAESRSGSTWLINTLNSHADIGLLDEIINPDFAKRLPLDQQNRQQPGPITTLQEIENQINQLEGKYQGCKILFPQAVRFFDFYEFILNYRNAYFIVLQRQNSVRAEISGLIANEHKRWHLIEMMEKQQIAVDPSFLFERLLWRKYTKEFCINMLEAYCSNVLHVEYSQLFSNMHETLEKISSFLAISPTGYTFSMEKKSNPFPLKELISNYQECISFFEDKPEYLSLFTLDNPQE